MALLLYSVLHFVVVCNFFLFVYLVASPERDPRNKTQIVCGVSTSLSMSGVPVQ